MPGVRSILTGDPCFLSDPEEDLPPLLAGPDGTVAVLDDPLRLGRRERRLHSDGAVAMR